MKASINRLKAYFFLPARLQHTRGVGLRLFKLVFLVLFLVGFSSCDDSATKWYVTLKKEEKKPYGTYLAYNSLQQFFPTSRIGVLSPGYNFNHITNSMSINEHGKNLMILVGINFYLSDEEWEKLRQFVRNGNEVVLFANALDKKIEDELTCHLNTNVPGLDFQFPTPQNTAALTVIDYPGRLFTYKGKSIASCFTANEEDSTAGRQSVDSNVKNEPAKILRQTSLSNRGTSSGYYIIADTLGFSDGKPDCIRFRMGNGHITIHAAPTVMSNYFLLQDGNIDYLSKIWSSIPGDIYQIYWNNYLIHYPHAASSTNGLWNSQATRWAFLLTILIVGTYVLFQSRRRQRIIPVIPPLRNDSVSFVETVGRLYYNTGNNANLAEKMTQQFLEWVRLNYYLNTNILDDTFITQLSLKSGTSLPVVSGLVSMIHELRTHSVKPDDAYIHQLYKTIQLFYTKNNELKDERRRTANTGK